MTLILPTRREPLTVDAALRDRAAKVIPGGMYGHMKVSSASMPPSYPQYYSRGAGSHLWDVDGNEYIDFMCGFGPMILGYANEEVDAAASAQQALGDAFTGPTGQIVELAELMTETVAHADWAMFAKNGTDATSMAVVIARAATGRSKLLKAASAYHGANAWFTPGGAGVTPEDRANIVEFDYNDLASLEAAAATVDGQVAAIIVPPFKHDAFADQELATVEFAKGVRALADRIGAALILDEVRTGLRLDQAGAWEGFGVRPDLTAFSKAIANGYALAAVTGTGALAEAASSVYVTGSFWYSGASMAASRRTITLLQEIDGIGIMETQGTALREGLAAQAKSYGFEFFQTGPVQMPIIRFADDPELKTMFAFTDATVRRGLLLHPWHNMFLSAAHTSADIEAALVRTDEAFAEIKKLGF